MSTTSVAIKLDADTRERLKSLGEARQRTPHWLMKQAIARYLEEEEAYEQEKEEDDACWQRYLDTGAHIGDDEMEAWLQELAGAAGPTESSE